MHANPKCHLPGTLASIPCCHSALNFSSAINSFNYARELGKQSVAHQLHGTAPVFCNCWIDHFGAVFLEQRERSLLVVTHHPAIADGVSGQDGGQSAFHECLSWLPRKRLSLSAFLPLFEPGQSTY